MRCIASLSMGIDVSFFPRVLHASSGVLKGPGVHKALYVFLFSEGARASELQIYAYELILIPLLS